MTTSLRLGICAGPERTPLVAGVYDYIELPTSALSPLEEDEAFAPRMEMLKALSLPVRALNVFIPREIKLVGEAVDRDLIERYVNTAIRRAGALGVETIVFGSGGARQVPEGFPREKAWAQLVDFLHLCAEQAREYGITLAIEPLNKKESNILNTYLEGVALAREVDLPEVRVLADLYHFMEDGEPLEDIAQAPEWLCHVHVADSDRRHPGTGIYPLPELFALLRQVGYQGKVSVECRWGEDFAQEAREAAAFLRSLASQGGKR